MIYEGEVWLPIPGTDGLYSASSVGRIRSEPVENPKRGTVRGRVMKASPNCKTGRMQVSLTLPLGRVSALVHRLVAAAFLGQCPDGLEVNHKDGDHTNNRPENLEYVTGLENIQHGWRLGLFQPRIGEDAGNVKLTEEDVRTIRAIYPAKTLQELGDMFGVSWATIQCVVKRKTWKHVA